MVTDIIEFEENNFEDLVESFLNNESNNNTFQEWLWDNGYIEFLTSDKMCAKWSDFVQERLQERQNDLE